MKNIKNLHYLASFIWNLSYCWQISKEPFKKFHESGAPGSRIFNLEFKFRFFENMSRIFQQNIKITKKIAFLTV
jgi:hypothetical protein